MYRRLQILVFTFNDYLCRVVHILTLDPVETMSGPSKASWSYLLYQHSGTVAAAQYPKPFAFGGPGGSRTRVQNPFHSTSYNNFKSNVLCVNDQSNISSL